MQTGRSMLEMLAVLAIMGALSIGGLWGLAQARTSGQAIHIASEVSYATKEMILRDDWRGLKAGSSYRLSDVEVLDITIESPYRFSMATTVPWKVCRAVLPKLEKTHTQHVNETLFTGSTDICGTDEDVVLVFTYTE